ncbi:N-acetylneuraminate synthase [Hahella sp. HN01]|uniref:N-acetylneuraminate synthase n=1 Tax=Hahella sp. HN01 TaxID=2847262 RepID=UPI001C1EF6E7|nr:N-acetylneuraminate synthase [Hahella sp. HN01]
MKTLIIAEAGVNHNGDEAMAHQLIEVASVAGADVVKFQTFKADLLATAEAPKAAYQKRGSQAEESQLQMLRQLELEYAVFRRLRDECDRRGIGFMSTAFESRSLKFLVDELGVEQLKIPSGEITNAPFLLEHAAAVRKSEKGRLILSTGMATLGEVESALSALAFGLLAESGEPPSPEAFEAAWGCREGREAVRAKVTLLHCTTDYPTPFDDVRLRVMQSYRQAFGVRAGYSDHTQGVAIALAAAALGADVVEKHFTLDRNLPGPDHMASLEPDELQQMVAGIRAIEQALQESVKVPSKAEMANRKVARKSLVAARAIKKGEPFDALNVAVSRPGGGMSPFLYWRLLGGSATRDYQAGELICE